MADEIPEHFKEVVKGSAWNLAGNLFFKAVSFFYYILIARAVSQGELDLFFLAFGIISMIDPLDDLGLAQSLARYIPFMDGRGEKGKVKELMVAGYAVSFIASVLLGALVFSQSGLISSIYHDASLAPALQGLSVLLVLSNISKITIAFLQGYKDIKGMQALSNAQNILKLAITLIMFWLSGPTVLSLSIGVVLSTAISILLISPFIIRGIARLPGEVFRWPEIGPLFYEVLSFGIALSVVNVVGGALFATDVVFLGYFFTGSVAVYSVAYTLAFALTVLPYSMDSIFSPLLASFHGRDEMGKVAQTIDAAQRWAFFMIVPPAIVFLSMPEYVLSAIFGESYASGAAALSVLVLSMAISALFHPIPLALTSMKMVGRMTKVMIPAGVLFAFLAFFLTQSHGILGPPLAALAANLFMFFAYRHELGKVLRLDGMLGLGKMAIGALAVLAIMLLSKPMLLWLATLLPAFQGSGPAQVYLDKGVLLAYLAVPSALSFLLFAAAVLLLKCLEDEDVSIFKRALRKMMVPEPVALWLGGIASHGVSGKS